MGQITNYHENRLPPKNVDYIVLLNSNLKCFFHNARHNFQNIININLIDYLVFNICTSLKYFIYVIYNYFLFLFITIIILLFEIFYL